jgi:hypothetical protein
MYYTYAYLRKNGTPYYIGKGSGNRAYHQHKRGLLDMRPSDCNRILILKKFENENDAFIHEMYMINIFGRKDLGTGILHNKTNGGENPPNHLGFKRSLETRKKLSDSRKGKPLNYPVWNKGKKMDDEYRKKCDHWSGKNHSFETRQKMSKTRKGRPSPTKGKRWWTNGQKTTMSVECPGDGWRPGRL